MIVRTIVPGGLVIVVSTLAAVWAPGLSPAGPDVSVPTDCDAIILVADKPAPKPLPPGTVDGLQAVRSKASALNSQVKSVATKLSQANWSQTLQAQLPALRKSYSALQQDVGKLQAANRTANLAEGIRLTNTLQTRVTEVGKTLDGLGQARDFTAARGFATQISTSLDTIIKDTVETPLCCAERTCCYVGIR